MPEPDVNQSEVEAATREHLFAIQAAQLALDKAHETACKVLEKVRHPFSDPPPNTGNVNDLPACVQVSDAEPTHAMDLTTIAPDEFERASNPSQDAPIDVPHMPEVIDVPWTADPGPVMPGAQMNLPEGGILQQIVEPENAPGHPIQGIIYEGGPDFNSGHTAVIRYE